MRGFVVAASLLAALACQPKSGHSDRPETERGLELHTFPTSTAPPCGCPYVTLRNRTKTPMIIFPRALRLEIRGAEATAQPGPVVPIWTGAVVLAPDEAYRADWDRFRRQDVARGWKVEPGEYRATFRYDVPDDIAKQIEAAGVTLPAGEIWAGTLQSKKKVIAPPPQLRDDLRLAMTRAQVIAALGEPTRRDEYVVQDGLRMMGPGEDFFARLSAGSRVETWSYDDVYGILHVYFVDGSDTVSGRSFSMAGAVY